MNRLFSTSVLVILLSLSFQQNCLAADDNTFSTQASSVSNSGDNSVGQVTMAIQQSNLPDDSRHVNVSYENNSIILRGTVASDKDRSEIGGMAEKCGCINIKNEIKVIPPTKKYATTTIVIPQPPSATAKTTPEKEPPKATEKTTEKSSATSTAPKTVK